MGSINRPAADRRSSEKGMDNGLPPRRGSEQFRDRNNRDVRAQEAAEYMKNQDQRNGRTSIPTGPRDKGMDRQYEENRRAFDDNRRSSAEYNGSRRGKRSHSRSGFSSPYRRESDNAVGFRDPPRWEGSRLERSRDDRSDLREGDTSYNISNNTSRVERGDLPIVNKSKALSDTDTLVKILADFADCASTQSSLQQRYDKASAATKRITEEYNKSKPVHKNFPTMEESQKAAVESAQSDLKDIENQLDSAKANMGKVIRKLVFEMTTNVADKDDDTGQKALNDRLERLEEKLEERFDFCQIGLDETENRWTNFEKVNESKWEALHQDASMVLRDISALQKAIPIGFKLKMDSLSTEVSSLPHLRMEQTKLFNDINELKELFLAEQAARSSQLEHPNHATNEDIEKLQEEQKSFLKRRETEDSVMRNKLEQLTSRCSMLESSLKEFHEKHDRDINGLNSTVVSLRKTQADAQRNSGEELSRTATFSHTPPVLPSISTPILSSNVTPVLPSLTTNLMSSSALMPQKGAIAPIAPMAPSSSHMQSPGPPSGLDQKMAAFQNAIDGVMLDVHHLDVRMSNISTDQMARQMLGQLENAYPNLRRVEDSIQSLYSHTNQQAIYQNEINVRVGALEKAVVELSTRVATVETRSMSRQDTEPGVDTVRSDVEKVVRDVSDLRKVTQDVAGVRLEVQEIAVDVSDLKRVAQDVAEVKKDKDTMDMTLKNLGQDLENSRSDALKAQKIFIARIGKLEDKVDALQEATKKASTNRSSNSRSPSPPSGRDYLTNSLKRKLVGSENGSKKQRRVSRAPFSSGSDNPTPRPRQIGGFIDDSD